MKKSFSQRGINKQTKENFKVWHTSNFNFLPKYWLTNLFNILSEDNISKGTVEHFIYNRVEFANLDKHFNQDWAVDEKAGTIQEEIILVFSSKLDIQKSLINDIIIFMKKFFKDEEVKYSDHATLIIKIREASFEGWNNLIIEINKLIQGKVVK